MKSIIESGLRLLGSGFVKVLHFQKDPKLFPLAFFRKEKGHDFGYFGGLGLSTHGVKILKSADAKNMAPHKTDFDSVRAIN